MLVSGPLRVKAGRLKLASCWGLFVVLIDFCCPSVLRSGGCSFCSAFAPRLAQAPSSTKLAAAAVKSRDGEERRSDGSRQRGELVLRSRWYGESNAMRALVISYMRKIGTVYAVATGYTS